MKDTNTITVYWAPSHFAVDDSSWSLLYAEPISLSSFSRSLKSTYKDGVHRCPAFNDGLNNTFLFKSNIDDTAEFSSGLLKGIHSNPNNNYPMIFSTSSHVSVHSYRNSSFNDHVNVEYNMGWLLFADEPVVAKFTAPYFPAIAPAEGAMLATGEFDIGTWYRPYVLDYHIPVDTQRLVFKENDPLFYVEFKTDKKVILKRYLLTSTLKNLETEVSASHFRYGSFKNLTQRYAQFKRANLRSQILTEIKKNLVED